MSVKVLFLGCPVRLFVCLFVCSFVLLSIPFIRSETVTKISHEDLETADREYSLAPTDDLVRWWRLKVKRSH